MGGAGAQLDQSDSLGAALLMTAQHVAIETHGAVHVGDAQDDMVDGLDGEYHAAFSASSARSISAFEL